MLPEAMPIYHGKRNFLGLKDLVISFYTEQCPFSCSFCGLKSRSSKESITETNLFHQIDWIFDQYSESLSEFQQVSIGNEGSILDRNRFFTSAMDYLLKNLTHLTQLQILSLETRAEYIRMPILEDILKKINAKLDITIGFETQDDYLRNEVLNKKLDKHFFENKVSILGELEISLTSYVVLKPGPTMNEEEGINEAEATIEYLAEVCDNSKVNLIVYINPTYVATNSPLARQMRLAKYIPPKIQSVRQIILDVEKLGIPIYTGLWSESLASSSEDLRCHPDFDDKLKKALKEFNKTQDYSLLR